MLVFSWVGFAECLWEEESRGSCPPQAPAVEIRPWDMWICLTVKIGLGLEDFVAFWKLRVNFHLERGKSTNVQRVGISILGGPTNDGLCFGFL